MKKTSRLLNGLASLVVAFGLLISPVSSADKEGEQLVVSLRSVILVDDDSKIGKHTGSGSVVVDGPEAVRGMKELMAYLQGLQGKALSHAKLDKTLDTIVEAYRQDGRPVVYTHVVKEGITKDSITIVVRESAIGEVMIIGNNSFSKEMIRKHLVTSAKSGHFNQRQLLQDANWLNKVSPGYMGGKIEIIPGQEYGTADAVVRVGERNPYKFSVGYEDSGNALTGDDRLIFGGGWGNAWGVGHTLEYRHITDVEFSYLSAHSGSYRIPLPWQHVLTIVGSFADVNAEFPLPVSLSGQSWQVGAYYEIPLPTIFNFAEYVHNVILGFDFKNSNNNLSFGGTSIFASDVDIVQWKAGYQAQVTDDWGWTSFGLEATYSPGGLTDNNENDDFNIARLGSKAEYAVGQLNLQRSFTLPAKMEVFTRGSFQTASGNLQASEGFGMGGYSTIRGFEETEFNADHGAIASLELRAPPVSIASLFNKNLNGVDRLVFLGFLDYGHGWLDQGMTGQDDDVEMMSAGPGLRYNLGPLISVRVDYGFQVIETGFNNRFDDRWHVGATIQY